MDFETIEKISAQKDQGQTETLKRFHRQNLDRLSQNWPIKKTEEYKFTGLKSFFDEFENDQSSTKPVSLDSYLDHSFITVVCLNGEVQLPVELPLGLKMIISSEPTDQLAPESDLSHLHQAMRKNLLTIIIDKNTIVEKPIRLIYLSSTSSFEAPAMKIHLKSFAKASLVEEIQTPERRCCFVQQAMIEIEEGAKLEHLQVSKLGPTSLHLSQTTANVSKHGTYSNFLLNLTGRLNRKNLEINLLEAGAHGESYNLYLTSSNEHSDMQTVIHHKAADTTSNQLAKGILDGESKGIFTGKIFIHPKAQRVSSGQTNKNLLLSKKAQAHSQPQLEIFADDVKCSHGSTTGQLSDDEIFYFESRGIPAKKAKTLLAFGFALEIVSKITHPIIRKNIESVVMSCLKDKFQLEAR